MVDNTDNRTVHTRLARSQASQGTGGNSGASHQLKNQKRCGTASQATATYRATRAAHECTIYVTIAIPPQSEDLRRHRWRRATTYGLLGLPTSAEGDDSRNLNQTVAATSIRPFLNQARAVV